MMDVMADNVWASPSTLHLRVHVYDASKGWRRKYDVAIPIHEIAPEAIGQLFLSLMDDGTEAKWMDEDQLTLDM